MVNKATSHTFTFISKSFYYSKKKNAPTVRVTAFPALVRREYGGIEKMVLDNYKDTASLTVWYWDVGWSEHVIC